MVKKIVLKVKNWISNIVCKVFGKRCECKEEVVINERMKKKIAAGHTNVSK